MGKATKRITEPEWPGHRSFPGEADETDLQSADNIVMEDSTGSTGDNTETLPTVYDKNGRKLPDALVRNRFKAGTPPPHRDGSALKVRKEFGKLIVKIGNQLIIAEREHNGRKKKYALTRWENLILQMFEHPDPAVLRLLLEYGLGKVPVPVDVTTDGQPLTWSTFIGSDNAQITDGEILDDDTDIQQSNDNGDGATS